MTQMLNTHPTCHLVDLAVGFNSSRSKLADIYRLMYQQTQTQMAQAKVRQV